MPTQMDPASGGGSGQMSAMQEPVLESPKKEWVIYGLTDPESGSVMYVGRTFSKESRLAQHIYAARLGTSERALWVRQVLSKGLKPGMLILETGMGDCSAAEKKWISLYASVGKLVNSDGGGSGRKYAIKKPHSVFLLMENEDLKKLRVLAAQSECSVSEVIRRIVHRVVSKE